MVTSSLGHPEFAQISFLDFLLPVVTLVEGFWEMWSKKERFLALL